VEELLVGAGAFAAWGVLWAAAAALLTVAAIVMACLLETHFALPEQWTFSIWIIALALCPPAAFLAEWALAGWLVPERLYQAVRFGGLAAGIAYVAVGTVVVARRKDPDSKTDEVVTLVVSSLTDLACCAALVFCFDAVVQHIARGVA
jgi:hypothetical protein